MNVLLDHALDYAGNGWPVLPCRETLARPKQPYTRNGVDDATTNPDQIRRWWQQRPGALIGVRVPATVLVLDIDPRNEGSYQLLADALGGVLPPTLTAWSGRGDGGRHLYYQRPTGDLTSTNLPAGIDLKLNGYCIAPPSPHPTTGDPYRWEGDTMAVLPVAAVRALRRQARPAPSKTLTGGDGSHLVKFLHQFPTHGINKALFWAACRAAEDGHLERLRDDLIDTAVALGESQKQAAATVESAARKIGGAA